MITVLGLGNVLMGDDGFGPSVIQAFEAAYEVGPGVEVVDLGTPGLDLMPWLADVDQVVIVDAVKGSQPPGTMRLYQKSDVLRHPPPVRAGPHDPGVTDALQTLEFAGRAPRELTLIGVVPARTELAVNLSPSVRAAVAPAVQALVGVLERSGVTVTRRADPQPDVPWWTMQRITCSGREGFMKAICSVYAVALATLALSCTAAVRPVRVNAGEQCFRCQRTIMDTRMATEQITGFVEKFRTPGCMAKYVVKNPADKGPIFVTDFATGNLIAADDAFLVSVVVDDRTGERDYRAYALKSDADAAAEAFDTTTVDWRMVLDRARGL